MGLWSWWKSWLRPKRRRLVHVRLLTRRGCHLCGEARRLLDGRRKRYDFTMEAVDVDNDADLAARYGGSVPVVFVNGKQRFCGRVAPALLDRLLKVEAG